MYNLIYIYNLIISCVKFNFCRTYYRKKIEFDYFKIKILKIKQQIIQNMASIDMIKINNQIVKIHNLIKNKIIENQQNNENNENTKNVENQNESLNDKFKILENDVNKLKNNEPSLITLLLTSLFTRSTYTESTKVNNSTTIINNNVINNNNNSNNDNLKDEKSEQNSKDKKEIVKKDDNTYNALKIAAILTSVTMSGAYIAFNDEYVKIYFSDIDNQIEKLRELVKETFKVNDNLMFQQQNTHNISYKIKCEAFLEAFTTWRNTYAKRINGNFYSKIGIVTSLTTLTAGAFTSNLLLWGSAFALPVFGSYWMYKRTTAKYTIDDEKEELNEMIKKLNEVYEFNHFYENAAQSNYQNLYNCETQYNPQFD
jgi:hypothetical protein